MFAELELDEDDFEGFHVRQRTSEVKEIMKTLKLCIEDSSLKNINEDDVLQWISAEHDLEISLTFTDQQIIDSVITHEKMEENNFSEEFGNEDNVMEIEKK